MNINKLYENESKFKDIDVQDFSNECRKANIGRLKNTINELRHNDYQFDGMYRQFSSEIDKKFKK